MSCGANSDWNPEAYARFRGLRLRPALDLLGAVGELPPGPVVDLGCGNGAAGEALAALGRDLLGVDGSPAMLDEALSTGLYAGLERADIARWQAEAPPALIFSNAALHWLGDHATLLPRLAGMLAPGGWLAVQMPHQNEAPSHRTWLRLAHEMFPGREGAVAPPGVLEAEEYDRILAPIGRLSLWETRYFQRLAPCADGHPVRRFTEPTFARPILEGLEAGDRAKITAAYDAAMKTVYPKAPDGSVLFPFRRLFFTLQRP
ncbi:MAG TPA: trans-aconitate methyltransferase [Rhodobacteraceae bacterium]|nr:trans-aconitate methyltransferase [Paracoccaceae bacterium]